jgi:hypothetical protein
MFPIAWLSDVRSRLIITYEENAVQLILVWNRPTTGVSKEVVRLGDWVQLLTVLLILVASEGPVRMSKPYCQVRPRQDLPQSRPLRRPVVLLDQRESYVFTSGCRLCFGIKKYCGEAGDLLTRRLEFLRHLAPS